MDGFPFSVLEQRGGNPPDARHRGMEYTEYTGKAEHCCQQREDRGAFPHRGSVLSRFWPSMSISIRLGLVVPAPLSPDPRGLSQLLPGEELRVRDREPSFQGSALTRAGVGLGRGANSSVLGLSMGLAVEVRVRGQGDGGWGSGSFAPLDHREDGGGLSARRSSRGLRAGVGAGGGRDSLTPPPPTAPPPPLRPRPRESGGSRPGRRGSRDLVELQSESEERESRVTEGEGSPQGRVESGVAGQRQGEVLFVLEHLHSHTHTHTHTHAHTWSH
ncbi:LOW QUALITY PROTEIN: hypothetical protein CRUP_024594 [Coryphaenoides rupestris]|nr:LOW QUALITY PROTEIN: hypothetical protein CRUP_024594 [Coryphaenoides rupestris]